MGESETGMGGDVGWIAEDERAPLFEQVLLATLYRNRVPFEEYDPQRIGAHYKRHPIPVFTRLALLALPAAPVLARVALRQIRSRARNRGEASSESSNVNGGNEPLARAVVAALTAMGPTFVKLGQLLSNRPDVVTDPALLTALRSLQDAVAPFPHAAALRALRAAPFPRPFRALFPTFPSAPAAAASLGQVYDVYLDSAAVAASDVPATAQTTASPTTVEVNGDNARMLRVAVKVQRPGVSLDASIDLLVLRWAARVVRERLKFRSDLVQVVDEFGLQLFAELDYRREAQNAARFAQLYGSGDGVRVPRVYPALSSQTVLVMEWIEGRKLVELDPRVPAERAEALRLTSIGVRCSLEQLLDHGFYHLDPHGGNLLRASGSGELVYLDFGMMAELSPARRTQLIASIVHLINRDYNALAVDLVQLGFLPPESRDDAASIAALLELAFRQASPSAKLSALSFSALVESLSGLARRAPIRIPPYYVLIIRSLAILEGIALGFDPNFKIVDAAYPYVLRRLLTVPNPALLAAARELIVDSDSGLIRWTRLDSLLADASSSPQSAPHVSAIVSRGGDSKRELLQMRVLEFFVSENGRFLRDALQLEAVEVLDELCIGVYEDLRQLLPGGALMLPVTLREGRANDAAERLLRAQKLVSLLTAARAPETPRANISKLLSEALSSSSFSDQRQRQLLAALTSARAIFGHLSARNSARFWAALRRAIHIRARQNSATTSMPAERSVPQRALARNVR